MSRPPLSASSVCCPQQPLFPTMQRNHTGQIYGVLTWWGGPFSHRLGIIRRCQRRPTGVNRRIAPPPPQQRTDENSAIIRRVAKRLNAWTEARKSVMPRVRPQTFESLRPVKCNQHPKETSFKSFQGLYSQCLF